LSFLSTLFPLLILPFVKVFHKDQSLVLSYSYSTLLLSVLLSLVRLSVIIYLLMTLNCSSPSGHLNSLSIFYTYKIQLILSLNGCLQIFSHSINLKLSFFLLVYLLNYLKSLILLCQCLLMSLLLQLNLLIILALCLIIHSRCLIISPQFLNLASCLFAISEG